VGSNVLYAISYLHYEWTTASSLAEAEELAKKMETDREILDDKSQRGIVGCVSDLINIYYVGDEDYDKTTA
tara:strand:+ start:5 stop:217 length:213 start_codon:yes stop_codon:yes gene_type:complete